MLLDLACKNKLLLCVPLTVSDPTGRIREDSIFFLFEIRFGIAYYHQFFQIHSNLARMIICSNGHSSLE
jgi:hypothetical protein